MDDFIFRIDKNVEFDNESHTGGENYHTSNYTIIPAPSSVFPEKRAGSPTQAQLMSSLFRYT